MSQTPPSTPASTPSSIPPPARRRPRLVETRPPREFRFWRWLAAAPALMALASSLLLAGMISTRSPEDVLPWYKETADHALAERDYQLASVCYQRLASDQPEDLDTEFRLALSLNGAGRQHEAGELLAHLTPEDGPGYPPARLLLAQQLLSYPARTPAMVDRAERNLLQIVTADPVNETAHGLLATIYAGEAKWALCRHHLARSGSLRAQLEARLLPGGVQPDLP